MLEGNAPMQVRRGARSAAPLGYDEAIAVMRERSERDFRPGRHAQIRRSLAHR
jgi:hypothetical protein